MARGKHAAKSAIRRAEAAHEHIDRLTDQLVEAKTRARRFEAAATRLPSVEQELRRLRKQLEDDTSDEVDRLNDMLTDSREQLRIEKERFKSLFDQHNRVVMWLRATHPGTGLEFLEELLSHGAEKRATIAMDAPQRRLSTEGVRRIQQARGERRGPPVGSDEPAEDVAPE